MEISQRRWNRAMIIVLAAILILQGILLVTGNADFLVFNFKMDFLTTLFCIVLIFDIACAFALAFIKDKGKD